MFPSMPPCAQMPVNRSLHEKLVRAYARQADRLRELAARVTTARLRYPLLEEADNQDRLAQAARRGIIRPQPQAAGSIQLS